MAKTRKPTVKYMMPQGSLRVTLAQLDAALTAVEAMFGLPPIDDETDADLAEYERIGAAMLRFGP